MRWIAMCALFGLQQVPPQALVRAMVISYALGFVGMLLAYLNYRKRHPRKGPPAQKKERPE